MVHPLGVIQCQRKQDSVLFWPPTYLNVDHLHLNIDKNEHFFDHLPPLVYVDIEWPQSNVFCIFWLKQEFWNKITIFSLFRNKPVGKYSMFPFFDNAKCVSTLIWAYKESLGLFHRNKSCVLQSRGWPQLRSLNCY